jgi:hypothetical protein
MACAVINKEGGSLSSPCSSIYVCRVPLVYDVGSRPVNRHTHQSCPSSASKWKKTKSQLLWRYKNILKLVSAAWQSFDFIYSDMIEHHREQENLYYVGRYILITKYVSFNYILLSIKLKFPFRFQLCCAVERNFPSQNVVYFIFITSMSCMYV